MTTWEDWHKQGLSAFYGKPVASILLGTNGDVVITMEDHTVLTGIPEGDCCAYTEITDLTGDYTAGEPLVGIRTEALGSSEVDDWDVIDEFIEIITVGDKDVAVQCKCHHNGYYCGWIDWRVTSGWEAA